MLHAKPTTTCLVAGGAGFIGAYLCETLLNQHCFVICIDNLTTSTKLNLDRFKNHPHFQFIQKDLNTAITLEEITRPIDYIFHLAGVEAYMNGFNVNMDTLVVNSTGTQLLLELALKNHAKFLLGSSEQIYHYYHPGSDFAHYFGKSRAEEGGQIFLEAKRFSEAITVEYALEKNVDARITRLAFVYGPGMNLLSGSILSKMLLSSIKKTPITIPNDGMATIYPTYVADVVYGITKAMFSQSSKGRIYGLVQPHSITLLHLAYQIRDTLHRNLEIDFYKSNISPSETRITEDILKSQEALGWTPRISVGEGLKKTFNWLEQSGIKIFEQNKQRLEKTPLAKEINDYTHTSTQPVVAIIKPTSAKPIHKIQPTVSRTGFIKRLRLIPLKITKLHFKSRKVALISLSLFILIIVLTTPIIITVIFTNQAVNHLSQAQQALKDQNYNQLSSSLARSQTILAIIDKSYDLVEKQRNFFRFPFPEATQRQYRQGKESLIILQSLSKAQSSLASLMDIITSSQVGDPTFELQEIMTSLQLASEHLAYLKAEVIDTDAPTISALLELREQIKTSMQLGGILPDLLAFNGKKTLLIMIQDNQELRPTGGFLEAVGQLTVEKGKILDYQVFDVYSLDNLLKGEITPPTEITAYLGEKNWWLRDANFSPDFPSAAARVAWFYQKERGKTVDGVLSINLTTFKTLLGTDQTIYLPEFAETIDSSNIYERAQHHAEVNFFGGNGVKKTSFLESLSLHFFEKFKAYEDQSYPQFALRLYAALEGRDVSIWLPDTSSQAILSQAGWDGALRIMPDQLIEFGDIDISDYFAAFDANFGVNKVNYNIQKQLDQNITLTDSGKVNIISKLTYKNNSRSDVWPSGRYKTYTRFYLPESAKFDKLVLVNTDATTSAQKVGSEDLIKTTDLGKQVIGTLLEVPANSQLTAEVYYTLGDYIPEPSNTFNYALYLQKQSGIDQTPTTITINHPEALKVAKLSQKADIQPGVISLQSLFNKDHVFAVSFLR